MDPLAETDVVMVVVLGMDLVALTALLRDLMSLANKARSWAEGMFHMTGAEVKNLDLKVPHLRNDATGSTHHTVALDAIGGEAVIRDLDLVTLEDAGEEQGLFGPSPDAVAILLLGLLGRLRSGREGHVLHGGQGVIVSIRRLRHHVGGDKGVGWRDDAGRISIEGIGGCPYFSPFLSHAGNQTLPTFAVM
ncbi:hypothetical protein ABZP36_025269 [Zizania latifolia]